MLVGCMLTLEQWQAYVKRLASWLHQFSCSTSIIELQAPSQKKKKKMQSAVPGPSIFIQPFRQVLRVWFMGCWVLPASMCTHTILSLGNTQPWNFLLVSQEWSIGRAFDWICVVRQTSVLGNTLGGLKIDGVVCCTDCKKSLQKKNTDLLIPCVVWYSF